METYGGRLFENVCQAIGRDFQADAMVRLEAAGYPVVMHTHDEATAEVLIGQGSVEEMTDIMIERPEWAAWWPIRADGWAGQRYRKD
jgi:DNA polymerase